MAQKMNSRHASALGAGVLTLVAALGAGVAVHLQSQSQLEPLRQDSAQVRLSAVHAQLQSQLQRELGELGQQTRNLAHSYQIREALRLFRYAQAQLPKEVSNLEQESHTGEAQWQKYHHDVIQPAWSKRFGDQSAAPLADEHDPTAIWLRQQYIVNNPNPIGKKDQLLSGAESSFYNQVHVAYHPAFEQLQKNLQLDDLLLIEANTRRVLYSVAKRTDFQSMVGQGATFESSLDHAIQELTKVASQTPDVMFLTDLEPYGPALGEHRLFVVAPVFENDQVQGFLALQLSADRLQALLSQDGKWSGLGKNGDVTLVGEDLKSRNTPRLFIADAKAFLAGPAKAWPKGAKADMERAGNGVGRLKVDIRPVTQALKGKPYSGEGGDALGRPSLLHTSALQIPGFVEGASPRWVLMSALPKEDALRREGELSFNPLWTLLLALGLSGASVAWVMRRKEASGGHAAPAGVVDIEATEQPVPAADFSSALAASRQRSEPSLAEPEASPDAAGSPLESLTDALPDIPGLDKLVTPETPPADVPTITEELAEAPAPAYADDNPWKDMLGEWAKGNFKQIPELEQDASSWQTTLAEAAQAMAAGFEALEQRMEQIAAATDYLTGQSARLQEQIAQSPAIDATELDNELVQMAYPLAQLGRLTPDLLNAAEGIQLAAKQARLAYSEMKPGEGQGNWELDPPDLGGQPPGLPLALDDIDTALALLQQQLGQMGTVGAPVAQQLEVLRESLSPVLSAQASTRELVLAQAQSIEALGAYVRSLSDAIRGSRWPQPVGAEDTPAAGDPAQAGDMA